MSAAPDFYFVQIFILLYAPAGADAANYFWV